MGKKFLLIAPAILITILVLSLKTSVWNSYFQSELNKYINSSGWSIQVERAEGYLFSTSVFNNINLIHNNGSSLKIKESSINIGLFSSLLGTPVFDLLTLEGMHVNYSGDIYSQEETGKESDLVLNIPFHVRSFFVDGKVF